jgi:hypothetical protein
MVWVKFKGIETWDIDNTKIDNSRLWL